MKRKTILLIVASILVFFLFGYLSMMTFSCSCSNSNHKDRSHYELDTTDNYYEDCNCVDSCAVIIDVGDALENCIDSVCAEMIIEDVDTLEIPANEPEHDKY